MVSVDKLEVLGVVCPYRNEVNQNEQTIFRTTHRNTNTDDRRFNIRVSDSKNVRINKFSKYNFTVYFLCCILRSKLHNTLVV